MKYNTAKHDEAIEAQAYLKTLLDKKCLVEIKKVGKRRSLAQNNYLHLTFGIFAAQYGEQSTTAVKNIHYKKYANPELYICKAKNGELFLRSSADLTTEEMTRSIDRWRQYAAEKGINIPLPDEEEALRFYENMIEHAKYYM